MPKYWRIGADRPDASVLGEAAALIDAGGIVAYPTDTLYGLAVHPWRPAAVQRLFAAKGRDSRIAVPLIAADLRQVETYLGALPPLARRLADEFWPGPLTLVIAAPPGLSSELLGGLATVAVRVPRHAVAVALARAAAVPLTATSANLSGHDPSADPHEVLVAMGDRLDGFLDAGPAPGGAPSTIVDAQGEAPRLVRDGAVPFDRVVQFCVS
jgi:L-threonylcarbamoyladenylate synthase